MSRKGYTETEKKAFVEKIKVLRKEGLTFEEIGKKIGLHASTCNQWYNAMVLNNDNDNNELENLKRENQRLRELLGQYLLNEKLKEK